MIQKNSNEKLKKQRKTASGGKSYVIVSYMFLSLFLAMIVYMIYFQTNESAELLNSPYNNRKSAAAQSVIRGSILANDGTILASTTTDDEGNEIREYTYNNLFAQVVGYSDYGNAGLEATQNTTLLTSHENIAQQVQKELNNVKKNGDDIVTSLDVSLQSAAYEVLGGRKGAVVALDADTGKVLACVSQPDFNPNTIGQDWESLNLEGSGSPFLNRGIQGLYEPGSTFKIVTAIAYLEQYGTDSDFYFECTGEYTQGGYTMHCSHNAVHGGQTLADAFANSCNCAFSYIATELLDEDALAKTAERLHFNGDFDFGLPSNDSIFSLKKTTKDGLSMQTAIGQGDTLMTPMHVAMITDAVYNNGTMYEPQFINQVQSADNTVVKTVECKDLGTVIDPEITQILKGYMQGVCQYGTAAEMASLPYGVCGKTGTAEYANDQGYVHSWFTGFTTACENDIVITVVIEEAVEDETNAAQLAAAILSEYYG